ncbi:hypothetical protein GIB67_003234 [Kingdonia uniflora]|uniref:U3 small nucleolar RNA-associated protein 14 n=1 Tax=Kingdonia uniflora TaxID=39325 RepID=A0A7J7LGW2_9MAGN|nr:hypothetical protein GIB67_003234 [Kingdonia uniflora]
MDENLLSEDDESGDEGRHARMLQGITKMPAVYFEGKKIKTNLSESYPKSEINPSQSALDGGGRITMSDLLEPLQGMPHFHSLRKDLKNVDKNSNFIQAPLPKGLQDKAERIVAYKQTKKDITRWEPIVKRNREAPTLFFDKAADVGSGTVGALASRFEARTDFEKKMALHVCNSEIVDAHNNDGARLLELNKISVQDVKDRQNHLAKMRSLLFRHELKAKHIKKIKSKTYHNLLKKDRSKVTSAEMQLDPEAAKEHAMKQEYKRAEERMTLKHKNNSKWAKRILERGLSVQDDGTRASISQQLHQHTLLTRKMNSMKDTSSSDDSSEEDDDDDLSAESDEDGGSKLLTKAKEKTLKVIEEEDEIPRSGVFSLPFMERGLEKRKEEAYKEAKLALEEYELSLNLLESTEGTGSPKVSLSSGRRVFGAVDKQTEESNNRTNSNKVTMDSDSENDFVIENNDNLECVNAREVQKSVNFDTGVLRKELGHEPVFESIDDIVRDSAPKTTYEVAIFASDSSRKLKGENIIDDNTVKSSRVLETFLPQEHKEQDEYTDTESVDEMVDGTLSSGANQVYELPSQADLIRRAFAGDDVEDEFVKDKMETLNEENPEPEKPAVLPGWGDWTGIQQKRGLPSWMVEKHENATKKREEDIKRRKDANLEHVIITETIGKKVSVDDF